MKRAATTAWIRNLAVAAALSALLGCAGARPKPEWATAPGTDLAQLSSYAWSDASAGGPRSVLHSQARNAIRAELETRGYEESSGTPDFLVSHEVVEYERGQRSSPVRIGIGLGSWGRRVGGSVGTSVGVGGGDPGESYRLVVRAIDPEQNQELWVGGTTSFEMPADEQVIRKAVTGVMRGFPDSGE